jgi:membrane protease YdiL (CAAX protease family)
MSRNSHKPGIRLIAFIFIAFLMAAQLYSEEPQAISKEATPDPAGQTLSRNEVLFYGGIPYFTTFGMALAGNLIPEPYGLYAGVGLLVFAHIPHIVIDPAVGLPLCGINTGLVASGLLLNTIPDLYGGNTLGNVILNIGQKNSGWAYYEGYAKARQRARTGEYQEEFTPVKYRDLITSPWDMATMSRASVWLPLVFNTLGFTTAYYLRSGGETAVWKTGKAFIGTTEVPVLAGLAATMAIYAVSHTFTGLGEEAVFRGIGYEEMKISFGVLPAKIADAVLFPAMHIPQEIKAQYSTGAIFTNAAIRTAITLGLQWAYDDGGLKASVAQHMWIDVIGASLQYLIFQGVASAAPISITMEFEI